MIVCDYCGEEIDRTPVNVRTSGCGWYGGWDYHDGCFQLVRATIKDANAEGRTGVNPRARRSFHDEASRGLRALPVLPGPADGPAEDALHRYGALEGGTLLRDVPEIRRAYAARSALLRHGLCTLEQIADRSAAELLAIPRVGPTVVARIQQALASRGLALRGEELPAVQPREVVVASRRAGRGTKSQPPRVQE